MTYEEMWQNYEYYQSLLQNQEKSRDEAWGNYKDALSRQNSCQEAHLDSFVRVYGEVAEFYLATYQRRVKRMEITRSILAEYEEALELVQ